MKKLLLTFLVLAPVLAVSAAAAKTKPQTMPVPVQSNKKSPLLMTAAPLPTALPIGSKAPVPRILGWVSKEEVDFTKALGKKTVVLFFYVNSNGCARAFSTVEKLAKEFDGKAVFAAIGCDSYPQLKNFLKVNPLSIPVAADLELQTLNCFLRSDDRVPALVVIDRKGLLAWRGNPTLLAPTLKEIVAGKYDVQKAAEREKFSNEVGRLLKARNFEAVLTLLAAERLKYPDSFELLSLQCSIYAEQKKDYAHALAIVEAEIKRSPKKYANYALGLRIAQLDRSGKTPVLPWFDRIIAAFPDQPKILIDLARAELEKPTSQARLEAICKLCRAAWRAPKFASYKEQGTIGREYARALYYCARPDLAMKQIQATMKVYPKNARELAALEGDLAYYQTALKMSQELKGL